MKKKTFSQNLRALNAGLAGKQSITFRDETYTWCGGILLTVAVLGVIGLAASSQNGGWVEWWALAAIAWLVCGILGWLAITRMSLTVDARGIHVVNPINEAWIPWSAVRRVEGGGTALRIWTDRWSVAVWVIQTANFELWMSGPAVSDIFATTLAQEAGRQKLAGDVGSEPYPLSKVWRTSWRGILVFVVIAIALLPLFYSQRHHVYTGRVG